MKSFRFSRFIHSVVMLGFLMPIAAQSGSERTIARIAATLQLGKQATIKRLEHEYALVKTGAKAARKKLKGQSLTEDEKGDLRSLAKRAGALVALMILAAVTTGSTILLRKRRAGEAVVAPVAGPEEEARERAERLEAQESEEDIERELQRQKATEEERELRIGKRRKEILAAEREEERARREEEAESAHPRPAGQQKRVRFQLPEQDPPRAPLRRRPRQVLAPSATAAPARAPQQKVVAEATAPALSTLQAKEEEIERQILKLERAKRAVAQSLSRPEQPPFGHTRTEANFREKKVQISALRQQLRKLKQQQR